MKDMDKIEKIKAYQEFPELFKQKEPELYNLTVEAAKELTDEELASILKSTALSFDSQKKEYLNLTSQKIKEKEAKESLELFTLANKELKQYGDLSKAYFKEYLPIIEEAIKFWSAEVEKIESTNFTFTNNFDHVPSETVYQYFHEKLVASELIQADTLKGYLKQAFEKQEQPTNKINFFREQTQTNSKVRRIFYHYYNNIAGKPHGAKDRYVKLYYNYFEGFNSKFESEKSNFSK